MDSVAALKPRFDGTINFGHMLTALTIMITLGGLGTYAIRENATTQLAIASLQNDVKSIKTDVLPRITAVESVTALNSERITNSANTARALRDDFTSAVSEFRRVDTDIYNQVNLARIAIAGIESRNK